jgi:hypothetical protein
MEDDGVPEDEHGDQEMAHDQPGRELEEDDEAAEHDLTQHADHQPGGQPHQVGPAGDAPGGTAHGEDDRHRHQTGDQPVDELDHGRGVSDLARSQAALLAGGPVGTAQARPGKTHGSPGEDDEGQRHDGKKGDLAVGGGRDRGQRHHLRW